MKKTLLIIIGMLALCNVLRAQDTVPFGQFDNYFVYGNLPEFEKYRHYYLGTMTYPGDGGEIGKYFFSADSLTVYGIAAGIKEKSIIRYLADTTYDNSIEYLRLYYSAADTLQCLNQAPVHLHNNISYYLNCDTVNPPSSNYITEMHERYFPSPTTVVDSFYVGCTHFLHKHPFDQEHCYRCPPLLISVIESVDLYNREDYILCFHEPSGVHSWIRSYIYGDFSLLFPILTPPDSSNSIDDHGMLGRLTGVMPNPAAETAKVVSSFGLSRVEAYNLAGEKVDDLRLPSPSLSATLDLHRWPVGAYILRIHTPQGVATKKLTVVR